MDSAIIPAVRTEGPLLSASYQFHEFPVCLVSTMRRASKKADICIQASILREMNLDFELNDIFNFSRTHFYNVDVRTLDLQ